MIANWSKRALERLRTPQTRGSFAPVDAARRQLGLLTVADDAGQARIFWLIDLDTQRIADARFLAFGDLYSHPAADAFTEACRGKPVHEALRLPLHDVQTLLADADGTPSGIADASLAWIPRLQALAAAALPQVKLLPKPVEKAVYQRKREADWTAADRTWLPLSLLKKTAKVDALIQTTISARLAGATARIDALNDDYRIAVTFGGIPAESHATAAQVLTDAVRTIHPDLLVVAQ